MARLGELSDFGGGAETYAQMLIARMFQKSPFIKWLDSRSGFQEDATDFIWTPYPDATGAVKTRTVNNNYTIDEILNPNANQTGSLAFHGGGFKVDASIQSDVDRGLRDRDIWHDRKLRKLFDKWVVAYEALLFNGSGASGNIKGLKNIINGTDNLPGYSVTRYVNAASALPNTPDFFDLSDNTNFNAFIEMMINVLAMVPDGTPIIMNKQFKARLTTIGARNQRVPRVDEALRNNLVDQLEVNPIIGVSKDTISNIEPDKAGTPVNQTTSMYLLDPSEENLALITNSGLFFRHWDDTDNDQSNLTWWEMRCQWLIENTDSVLRLGNIKLGNVLEPAE